MSRPLFLDYEAVLLLFFYLEVEYQRMEMAQAVSKCSELLQEITRATGRYDGASTRNTKGIQYQLRYMGKAWHGAQPDGRVTVLFVRTVRMYHEDRDRYDALLWKARFLSGDIGNYEGAFREWLATHGPVLHRKDILQALTDLEILAREEALMPHGLYQDMSETSICVLRESVEQQMILPLTRRIHALTAALDYLEAFAYHCRESPDER